MKRRVFVQEAAPPDALFVGTVAGFQFFSEDTSIGQSSQPMEFKDRFRVFPHCGFALLHEFFTLKANRRIRTRAHLPAILARPRIP